MSPWCQKVLSYSKLVAPEGINHRFVLLFNVPLHRVINYLTSV